ncbi:MAG: hypothetical protein R3250_14475, partial [Melioribacteraceae bacterium]|nr:hypothetical protein [Melioribacteraceae bacterium]
MKNLHSILLICILFISANCIKAQYDDEPILYFQMEPLDDSLFVKIQESLFIDPPDPKAEIIVDLRDTKNSTIQIMRKLYPLIVLPEDLRARVQTYPFKLNLEDNINYTSVFTDVANKMKFSKLVSPPTKMQINSNSCYINPYVQLFGGERFGLPIKKDIGLSLGLGTP